MSWEEDSGIIIFLIGGVIVVALIVFFGVLSSSKKSRTSTEGFQVSARWIAGQPVLATSSMEQHAGKRQWELFQQRFSPGVEVPNLPVTDPAAKDADNSTQTLRVARLAREYRAGYPNAKIGFVAYFEPYEFAELPCEFPIGGRNPRTIALTREGVSIRDESGTVTWQSAWAECRFAGVNNELKLANGLVSLDRAQIAEHERLEALMTKYAALLGHAPGAPIKGYA